MQTIEELNKAMSKPVKEFQHTGCWHNKMHIISPISLWTQTINSLLRHWLTGLVSICHAWYTRIKMYLFIIAHYLTIYVTFLTVSIFQNPSTAQYSSNSWCQKASDRLEWPYLFRPGRRLPLMHRFQLNRSSRQGCPLSPALFVLAVEPLTMSIRWDPDINGFEIDHRNKNTYPGKFLVRLQTLVNASTGISECKLTWLEGLIVSKFKFYQDCKILFSQVFYYVRQFLWKGKSLRVSLEKLTWDHKYGEASTTQL